MGKNKSIGNSVTRCRHKKKLDVFKSIPKIIKYTSFCCDVKLFKIAKKLGYFCNKFCQQDFSNLVTLIGKVKELKKRERERRLDGNVVL